MIIDGNEFSEPEDEIPEEEEDNHDDIEDPGSPGH